MNRRLLSAGLLGAIAIAVASISAGLAGCSEGRFPVCHTNADCQPRDAGDGGPGELRSWDPNTWNECAQICKDQDCISACDRRFHAK